MYAVHSSGLKSEKSAFIEKLHFITPESYRTYPAIPYCTFYSPFLAHCIETAANKVDTLVLFG